MQKEGITIYDHSLIQLADIYAPNALEQIKSHFNHLEKLTFPTWEQLKPYMGQEYGQRVDYLLKHPTEQRDELIVRQNVENSSIEIISIYNSSGQIVGMKKIDKTDINLPRPLEERIYWHFIDDSGAGITLSVSRLLTDGVFNDVVCTSLHYGNSPAEYDAATNFTSRRIPTGLVFQHKDVPSKNWKSVSIQGYLTNDARFYDELGGENYDSVRLLQVNGGFQFSISKIKESDDCILTLRRKNNDVTLNMYGFTRNPGFFLLPTSSLLRELSLFEHLKPISTVYDLVEVLLDKNNEISSVSYCTDGVFTAAKTKKRRVFLKSADLIINNKCCKKDLNCLAWIGEINGHEVAILIGPHGLQPLSLSTQKLVYELPH